MEGCAIWLTPEELATQLREVGYVMVRTVAGSFDFPCPYCSKAIDLEYFTKVQEPKPTCEQEDSLIIYPNKRYKAKLIIGEEVDHKTGENLKPQPKPVQIEGIYKYKSINGYVSDETGEKMFRKINEIIKHLNKLA